VDTNTLFVDAANNRVGVGTSSPAYPLHVSTSTFPGIGVFRALNVGVVGAAGQDIQLGALDGSTPTPGASISGILNNPGTTGIMAFQTRSGGVLSERTRIDSVGTLVHKLAATFNEDGADADFRVESDTNTHALFVDASTDRVGIGTSVPDTTLEIQAALTPTIRLEETGSGGAKRLELSINNSSQAIIAAPQSASTMIFTVTGAEAVRYRPNAEGVIFNEDGADRDFRVESDGNAHMLFVDAGSNEVGIGTSNPLATLDVDGSGRFSVARTFSAGVGGARLLIEQINASIQARFSRTNNVDTTYVAELGADSLGFNIWPGGYANGSWITFGYPSGETKFNEEGSDIDFRVESDTNTHALFVDAGNNSVNIGTSSHYDNNYILNVNGRIRTNTPGSTPDTTAATGFQGFLITGGNQRLNIDVSNQTNGGAYIQTRHISINSFPTAYYDLKLNPLGGAVIVNEEGGSNGDFRVESDGNAHMLFVDAGNNLVGVGTSNPQSTLDVIGTIRSGTATSATFMGNGVFNTNRSDGMFLIQSANAAMSFYTNNTFRTQITSTGTLTHKLAATFNEDGADADFRVESDNNANMFVVDAGADKVLFGTNGYPNVNVSSPRVYDAVFNNGLSIGDATFTHGFIGTGGTDGNVEIVANSYPANLGSSRQVIISSGTAGGGGPAELARFDSEDGAVFNETSLNRDFRVESDNRSGMLTVDAGNDAVGIVAATSDAALNIGFKTGGKFIREYHNISYAANSQFTLFEAGFNDSAVDNTRVYQWRHYLEADNPGSPSVGHNYKIQALPRLGSYTDVLTLNGTGSYGAVFHRGLAVNEDGADADFRVESDTNAHMLFVDAAENYVGVNGVQAGSTALYVQGGITQSSAQYDPKLSQNFVIPGSGFIAAVGGSIQAVYGLQGSGRSGSKAIIEYASTSWKSFAFEITFSSTRGSGRVYAGGYNNGGGAVNVETTGSLFTSVVYTQVGQSQVITITLNGNDTHPLIKVDYYQTGGDGIPRGDRLKFDWVY
jgi:hypothetical protein